MAFERTIFALILLTGTALPAGADVVLGLWRTPPDSNGIVIQVRAKACGDAVCARVERVTDRRGIDKRSGYVGRRMIWDMIPLDADNYRGKFWDPHANRVFDADLSVAGNRIILRPCHAGQCRELTWLRVR